ncbi:MAG: efflux RND transporter permease subunit, partial [Gammaproteobacteria bacterium]|nr:efflux RND transporter permease subunit [Gammaproteobacteria bacterium]
MDSKFTDIFIRRPVLACVISLLIFFVGLRALESLAIRQFPKLENTLIQVTTSYPGASSQLIEGFITTLLEKQIAGADGIDYMTSTSTEGTSTINVYVKLNYDPNSAFTNVMSKVAQVQGFLPKESQEPVIQKETGNTIALMYIGFDSDEMSPEQITDYITRVVQPKLETISGVSEVQILGGNTFAMRIWLDPKRLAALGVSAADVRAALLNNNFQTGAGRTKGEFITIPINAKTDLQSAKGFANLIVKHGQDGALVRLRDVANVKLGSQNYDSSVYLNGKKAVFISIQATPEANPLQVIDKVKKILPQIKKIYPPSLHSKVVYDTTTYIRASINEVIKTIGEATVIVIIIIFLFLGSLRTVSIPIVTIPLSLIGVCGVMLALGYSLNLLTLLAMVLAIGMVVDDAIVVVENCYRHIEEGLTPFDAALKGAREIATPVISMTITLAAVYAPIGFMGGLTGALFTEFAFTLAAAVIVSGVIALTLSPMMCSRILSANIAEKTMVKFADRTFGRLKTRYEGVLRAILSTRWIIVMFAFVVLLSCMFLYVNTRKELAPVEDQSAVFVTATGPEDASLHFMESFTKMFNKIYSLPAMNDYFTVNGQSAINSVISAILLKPWDERKLTQTQVNNIVQKKFNNVAGLQIQAFPLPPLPTNGSPIPIQFELVSTAPLSQVFTIAQELRDKALKSGLFFYIDSTLKFNKPQINVNINRSKAGQLGINMNDVGDVLATSLGGNYINW